MFLFRILSPYFFQYLFYISFFEAIFILINLDLIQFGIKLIYTYKKKTFKIQQDEYFFLKISISTKHV